MDTTMIKTILETQNQAYKCALEIFIGQINQKIQSLQTTVSDLQRSLEFTQKEVDDLKCEVNQHQLTNKQDQDRIDHMTADLQTKSDLIKELEERCNHQEDQSRRNNLQFVGVEEHQDETWEQTVAHVTKLLEDKLKLPSIEVERAYRVGQRMDQRPRPLIAQFSRFCDREAVLRPSWSRVGVVPGSEAGGDGGVGGDAATPARSWASSGAAALARTDSTDSVSASMTGGGAAELTPASVQGCCFVEFC
ncbi:hypothetical protein Pcinc_016720 [Petrolisthes cinctipes]|uniref:Uncharacterized protein n=1 Tax=Petrolisthes cinctipes TaxID=88211 RepID=A0AAE1FRQ2_PETCI|nr:hypothetical protein Pcinc_016720 [Petrolisthes cinctipes]